MSYDFSDLAAVFTQATPRAACTLASTVQKYPRIFVYGAGRSGLMLKAFAMRLAQAGVSVYVVGETVTPAIKAGDLLLLASASGKTASTLRYAEIAHDVGADVFAVTADPKADLALLSNAYVCLPAPSKDSVGARTLMGTLFEQALLLLCDLAVTELVTDPVKMRAKHANLE